MRLFVWIPGTLGSVLRQRHPPHGEIWPPGQVNAFQSRTFAQLTDDLGPDGVIGTVCGQPIYSTIADLFDEAGVAEWVGGAKPAVGRISYSYDWRLGLKVEADRLADLLDARTAEGDEIVILAHSMGGLLTRYLTQAPVYDGRPFISRIKKFVAVNGALSGAPVMLARAMGLEPTQFIRWTDQPKLLATAPFSGAYNLLPAPWEGRLFNGADPIDIWDPYYYQFFSFGLQNMRDAADAWAQIKAGTTRATIEHVLITSLVDDDATIEQVAWENGAWNRKRGPGDGSVPPWSAKSIAGAEIPTPLPGEHLGVIHTAAFRGYFSTYVTALPSAPGPAAAIVMHPLKQDLRPGSVSEFAVVRQGADTAQQGEVTWRRLSDAGLPQGPVVQTETVALPAAEAPVLRSRVPDAPGTYVVSLTLDGAKANTRVGVRPADEIPVQAPPKPQAP